MCFLSVENFRLNDINLVDETMQCFRSRLFDTKIVFYEFQNLFRDFIRYH